MLIEDSNKLAEIIPQSGFNSVYSVPTGGILPAFIVSKKLNVPLISKKEIDEKTLIVDDLVDSGETLSELVKDLPIYKTAVLYRKPNAKFEPNYVLRQVGEDWINLPHEENDEDVKKILQDFWNILVKILTEKV